MTKSEQRSQARELNGVCTCSLYGTQGAGTRSFLAKLRAVDASWHEYPGPYRLGPRRAATPQVRAALG